MKRAKYNFVLIPPFFTRNNPDVASYINCFYILLQNKGRVNELLFSIKFWNLKLEKLTSNYI
jgi:hypothetical protein